MTLCPDLSSYSFVLSPGADDTIDLLLSAGNGPLVAESVSVHFTRFPGTLAFFSTDAIEVDADAGEWRVLIADTVPLVQGPCVMSIVAVLPDGTIIRPTSVCGYVDHPVIPAT